MSYTFSKDKNFFNFTDDETGEIVSFDVNLCKWIGKSGKPVKSNRIGIYALNDTTNLPPMLKGWVQLNERNPQEIILIDKLLSLGYDNLEIYFNTHYQAQFCVDNFKYLIEYLSIQVINDKRIYVNRLAQYISSKKFANLYEDRINPVMIRKDEFYMYIADYPIFEKYLNLFCHYCNKNYHQRAFYYEKLNDYFQKCEQLNIVPQKGDFCKNYSEILAIYNEKENEIKNKIVKKVQNSLALNGYTTTNFTLEIPQTVEDFRRLGEEFHNCLGSWELENRIYKEKYAVVILRGNDWKVAIDIDLKDHSISQKYMPYNHCINNARIKGYINDYQNYLYSL